MEKGKEELVRNLWETIFKNSKRLGVSSVEDIDLIHFYVDFCYVIHKVFKISS